MTASHGRATSAGGSRPKAAPLHPRQLTGYLSHARDLPELLALHRDHGDQFNYFQISAFWSNFKKLPRGQLRGLSDRLAPVCEQTVLMLPELNARALANLAHAFAKAGLVGTGPWESVWTALPEAIRRSIRRFDPQQFSHTAWAFAKAGHLSTELFKAISAEVVRRGLGDVNAQALSNTAWAFGGWNPPSADMLFGTTSFTARCAQLEKSFARLDYSQLHQWSLWREERGTQWPRLPESLRQTCHNAFVEEEGQPSQLQSEVVQEIRSTGDIADVEEEYRCKVSGYSIDALVTLKHGERIAVEVDGPSHFVGRSHQPTGATLLKHRQLRFFEWRLESVKYWEWEHSKELPWLPWRSR